MSELERWEIRAKNLREMRDGFLSLLTELNQEQNFTPETQDRQVVQIEVTTLAVNWLSDELAAAENMIEHYRQGGV